jgi:nucleotide-binding universal stress UspA family protein
MSEQEEALLRRILVALDASHHSLSALEAAADLAASLEAELQGLFVEDINLLRAAGSPVAWEVHYPYIAGARMDQARMERQLRAQATQAQRALAAACKHRRIKWSFRVVRGEVTSQVLEAAAEADLLSLGKASRPLMQRIRLGSTARAAATRSPRSVLLIQRDVVVRPPVMVIYEDSRAARQALWMAAHLAQKQEKYLGVLILVRQQDNAQRLQNQISNWLRGEGLAVRSQLLPANNVKMLAQTVRAEQGGLLVLSVTTLPADALDMLLDEVDCPVLLVR